MDECNDTHQKEIQVVATRFLWVGERQGRREVTLPHPTCIHTHLQNHTHTHLHIHSHIQSYIHTHTFILKSFLLTTKAVIWVSMKNRIVSRIPGKKAAKTAQVCNPLPSGLMTKSAVVLPDFSANKLSPATTFGTISFFVGYPTIWSMATQMMTDIIRAKLLTWRRIWWVEIP